MRSRLETVGSTDSSGTDLITLEDLKLELGIDDDSEDELLALRIARWSRMFADECGRTFAFAEGVETFTFEPGESWPQRMALNLSLYPVIDVVSVTQDGTAVEYELDAANGRLWAANGGWWSGTVVVTYSGGYVLPSEAPAGLVEAIIEHISELRTDAGRDTSLQSVSRGDTRVSYFQTSSSAGALSSTVLDLLQPFRRPVIA